MDVRIGPLLVVSVALFPAIIFPHQKPLHHRSTFSDMDLQSNLDSCLSTLYQTSGSPNGSITTLYELCQPSPFGRKGLLPSLQSKKSREFQNIFLSCVVTGMYVSNDG